MNQGDNLKEGDYLNGILELLKQLNRNSMKRVYKLVFHLYKNQADS